MNLKVIPKNSMSFPVIDKDTGMKVFDSFSQNQAILKIQKLETLLKSIDNNYSILNTSLSTICNLFQDMIEKTEKILEEKHEIWINGNEKKFRKWNNKNI